LDTPISIIMPIKLSAV
jgi:hypothetical protein